jgi:hypothetical protein
MITEQQWDEMNKLRVEISHNPAACTSHELERFSELFALSIAGKGDSLPYSCSKGAIVNPLTPSCK